MVSEVREWGEDAPRSVVMKECHRGEGMPQLVMRRIRGVGGHALRRNFSRGEWNGTRDAAPVSVLYDAVDEVLQPRLYGSSQMGDGRGGGEGSALSDKGRGRADTAQHAPRAESMKEW
eukprot:gene12786-biopygen12053